MLRLTFSLILSLALFTAALSPTRALISSCGEPRSANSQDNYPVNHADINLDVRNWQAGPNGAHNRINSIHGSGSLDAAAPQLNTIFENNTAPGIGGLFAVCNWAWDNGVGPGGHRESSTVSIQENPSDYASLVGLQGNGNVLVPQSGYNIGGGRQVIVLYATPNSITIKYGIEDSIVTEVGHGYAIHIENINVASDVLAKYNELNSAGRKELPALCAGHVLGTVAGSELLVSVRDSGGFMDPRWQGDWWSGGKTGVANNSCGIQPIEVKKPETVSRAPKIEPLLGRDPYCRLEDCQATAAGPASLLKTWHAQNPYVKSPYCPALGIQQFTDNPSETDFKYCLNMASRTDVNGVFYSCPDYAPNRPYPGDTCMDYQDLSKDNVNITNFEQNIFKKQTTVKYDLCEKKRVRGLWDVSCVGAEHTVRAWEKVNVRYDQAFVEYMGTGNEYTSLPNYIMSLKNNIVRTSLYLTDYLRGFFSAPGDTDRSDEMYKFLVAKNVYLAAMNDPHATVASIEKANIDFNKALSEIPNLKELMQMTSGVLNKLYTDEYKTSDQFDSNKVLLNRWLYANLPSTSGQRPKDKITGTPIGDYVIAYQCGVKGRNVMNEEDFPDSLERRKVVINWGPSKGKTCSPTGVLRISDFICGNKTIWDNPETQVIAAAYGRSGLGLRDLVCRSKKDEPADSANYAIFWPDYFPLMTREDTPVRVTLRCPSLSAFSYSQTGNKDLTEEELRAQNIDTYAKDNGYSDEFKMKKWMIVNRFYIYIGHLAEAREASYYADNLLLPAKAQINNKQDLRQAKAPDLPGELVNGTINAKPATTGDLVAQDAVIRYTPLDEQFKEDVQVAKKVKLNPNDGRLNWDGTGSPPQNTVTIQGDEWDCHIQVEMPFIRELAVRTIGEDNGFMRIFLPKSVGDSLMEQTAATDNRGASIAKSDYSGFGFQVLEPIKDHGEVTTSTSEDGKLAIPWVKQMQAFQTAAIVFGLNPSAATENLGNVGTQPGTGTSTPAYQQCLAKDVDYKAQLSDAEIEAAFNRFYPRIASGTFGENFLKARSETEARRIWMEMARTARAGGINPILALAYWGEETHFTSSTAPGNPDPRMAIGCGKPSDSPSCIRNYPGQPEQELRDEFRCIAGSNPSGGSCNLSAVCKMQPDAWGFIGCYQFGVTANNTANPPTDNHVRNLMGMYYDMLGSAAPNCNQFLTK